MMYLKTFLTSVNAAGGERVAVDTAVTGAADDGWATGVGVAPAVVWIGAAGMRKVAAQRGAAANAAVSSGRGAAGGVSVGGAPPPTGPPKAGGVAESGRVAAATCEVAATTSGAAGTERRASGSAAKIDNRTKEEDRESQACPSPLTARSTLSRLLHSKMVRATHDRRPGPPNSFTANKKQGGGDA